MDREKIRKTGDAIERGEIERLTKYDIRLPQLYRESTAKREKIQHPRKAVKKMKTQPNIRHAFFDPAHGSRVRLSAASLTNPFQAPILGQEVDHDPMPMDAYDRSSKQSRCDIVATNSIALSPCDFPPLQLQVESDQL